MFDEVDDDVIASLNHKVSHKLQEKKEDFSFAVFSNPIIRNSSFVVKRVRLEGIEFMRYNSWMEHLAIRKIEEETAKQKSFNVNGVSFDMISVEGGTFTMGASNQDSDASYEERPAHEAILSTFYIGKYEVTQELWQAVMGNNPSPDSCKGEKVPVVDVSWDDCDDFIKELNKLTGKKFRLPTEAEWEFAARGGKNGKGYKYAGNDNIEAVAWYCGNSGGHPHPVGQKQHNELSLYDMSGNVWEWCQDWYGSYSSNSQTNPTGASSGSYRVNRGGGWGNDARGCRSSRRSYITPSYGDNYLGLRLAL